MRKVVLLFAICFCAVYLGTSRVMAQTAGPHFRTIGLRQGLSNSQVGCFLKDSRGYVWFGTLSGLDRFDGFRFKNFYSTSDTLSLLSDYITRLEEDVNGDIWVETMAGYCLYHPATESFDRNMGAWMKARGMEGIPNRVLVDSKKQLWIAVNGRGVYTLKEGSKGSKARLFPVGQQHVFTDICETPKGVAVIDDHGVIITIMPDSSPQGGKVQVNNYLPKHAAPAYKAYHLRVDSKNRYWVSADGLSMVCCPASRSASEQWFPSIEQWLSAQGIHYEGGKLLLSDLVEDNKGNLWMATDHAGLLKIDKDHQLSVYRAEHGKSGALPDNTLQSLMLDDNGALWIGTLKNGAAYLWEGATRFPLLPLGDICTMVEDRVGNLWCGTNDKGIICYQPLTGTQRVYRKNETGLGTDVVICSLMASDGSLWFGTFQGGIAHYKDGHFQVYRVKDGLANDNVWSLAESPDGHIWIGTLGGGLQELDVKTGKWTTYDTKNSKLLSDYISTIFIDKEGNILIGHSQILSRMDAKTRQFTRMEKTRSGQPFINSMANHILIDSRGLIWIATSSGVNVYDPQTDQLMTMRGMSCSLVEDLNHNVWVVSDNGLTQVRVIKNEKGWALEASSYDSLDGLQDRQFNLRSILVSRMGDVLVGGQDGINVVPRHHQHEKQAESHALFTGLILFDHPLAVGEEYNGRVILKEALQESKRLVLKYSENAFTIQLAASSFVYPSRKQYLYRLVGFNDQWLRTSSWRSDITYTNLSPGTYRLQVQVLDRYGKPYSEISELEIVIRPPFYLTIWAILAYILLGCALLYYIYYRIMTRQKQKMDEMKMQFYTNASHELRTPLTLIISPLSHMISKEEDEEKRSQLSLVHRNAEKLLTLVNDILDFRKLDAKKVELNPVMGDIVERISSICQSFRLLQDKPIKLSFESTEKSLLMSYDDEKMTKVMNNLLSNAYKYTDQGEVRVSLSTVEQSSKLQICVSDTGKGISDEDKKHVFERFYQVSSKEKQPYGASGVGLNLVKDFVEMHGGTVSVADNPGGGSIFTVLLPINKTDEEPVVTPAAEEEPSVPQKQQDSVKADLLIVDDSDDFLEFMSGVMADSYQVRVAHDGMEALTLVKERKPDIILSDVMMPVMDGIELCRAIKGNHETERIPFVLLTARMAQESKIEGMESGADDYITKPFNIDLLTLRMNNLLKWKRSGRTSRLEPQVKEIEITSLDEKLVKDATEYVEQNISDDELSVETLSSVLNMSRVHLYKKLLSLTGNTPSEFIRLIRLRRAEQLLRQSQLNVAEVSYAVGFNNPRYFSKYFREMYGMTPSQYKDKYKEN